MRKLLFVGMLLLVFIFSGCNGGNELEKALETLSNADSLRMDITMDGIPFFGSMTMTSKKDGYLRYSSTTFGDPTYSKMIDGKEYEYVLDDNDVLVLSDVPNESEDEDEDDNGFTEQLKAEDFEKIDDEWILKEDRLYLDESEVGYMKDIVIVLDSEGNIKTMVCVLHLDGLVSNVEIEFSGINDTKITVPGS